MYGSYGSLGGDADDTSTSADSERCTACPHGTISTVYNSTSCTTCGNGNYAVAPAAACTNCAPGQYHASTGEACTDCAPKNIDDCDVTAGTLEVCPVECDDPCPDNVGRGTRGRVEQTDGRQRMRRRALRGNPMQ